MLLLCQSIFSLWVLAAVLSSIRGARLWQEDLVLSRRYFWFAIISIPLLAMLPLSFPSGGGLTRAHLQHSTNAAKRYVQAILMYAEAEERMPLAQNWSTAIKEYPPHSWQSSEVRFYPSYNFAYNANLSGAVLSTKLDNSVFVLAPAVSPEIGAIARTERDLVERCSSTVGIDGKLYPLSQAHWGNGKPVRTSDVGITYGAKISSEYYGLEQISPWVYERVTGGLALFIFLALLSPWISWIGYHEDSRERPISIVAIMVFAFCLLRTVPALQLIGEDRITLPYRQVWGYYRQSIEP